MTAPQRSDETGDADEPVVVPDVERLIEPAALT